MLIHYKYARAYVALATSDIYILHRSNTHPISHPSFLQARILHMPQIYAYAMRWHANKLQQSQQTKLAPTADRTAHPILYIHIFVVTQLAEIVYL